MGKSRQLIEAASGDTLVIAPAMVLDGGTWDTEIGKWGGDDHGDPGEGWYTAPYSGLNGREKTGATASSTRPVMTLRPEFKRPFETLILDEAQYVKGRKTTWTWAVQEIARKSDQVFLASGTPMPNWPHELFVPLRLLFPEDAKPGKRFGSYWGWIEEWFKTRKSRFGGPFSVDILGLAACGLRCADQPPTDPCEHFHEFVTANLGDRLLLRKRDDVLPDLPPLTEVEIEVPMTAKQAAAYRAMKKDWLALIGPDGDQELVAWSAGSRSVLLDRITTGLGVTGGGDPAEYLKDSGKLKRLAFDLESRAAPTLVVAHYQESVEAAAMVARSVGAQTGVIHGSTGKVARRKQVEDFQAGRIDVLCGSLETVAEGLTLTAADMVIFLEKSYKPSRNDQALRRIHRMGQDRPCTALDYVSVLPAGGRGSRATVDGNKRKLLATKSDLQMRVLTAAQFAQLL